MYVTVCWYTCLWHYHGSADLQLVLPGTDWQHQSASAAAPPPHLCMDMAAPIHMHRARVPANQLRGIPTGTQMPAPACCACRQNVDDDEAFPINARQDLQWLRELPRLQRLHLHGLADTDIQDELMEGLC